MRTSQGGRRQSKRSPILGANGKKCLKKKRSNCKENMLNVDKVR